MLDLTLLPHAYTFAKETMAWTTRRVLAAAVCLLAAAAAPAVAAEDPAVLGSDDILADPFLGSDDIEAGFSSEVEERASRTYW